LIDDLPAELDAGHRSRFLQLLGHLEAQAFVTATDLSLLDLSNQPIPPQVFHVEHGTVRAML
jgi:DNA replication and repair protein RecF